MRTLFSFAGGMGRGSVLVLLVVLSGCVTNHIQGASRDLLKFLQLGHTTQEEVLLNLGQPSASFEQERILTYRLGHDEEQGYYIISPRAVLPWQTVRYSLVLVFDAQGILQRQRLVDVQ